MQSPVKRTFVLGGARSGKSRYAESLIATLPPPWTYVATAEAGDLAAALKSCQCRPVLVDCLTLWLSNLMLVEVDIEPQIAELEQTLDTVAAPVVLVANEVGYGIVPDYPLGRRFRDWQGVLNQRMAARADRVVLVVAGLPLAVKGVL